MGDEKGSSVFKASVEMVGYFSATDNQNSIILLADPTNVVSPQFVDFR